MLEGPALSVPCTSLVSLLPWAGLGSRLEERGRVSWGWLSSRADSWGQRVLAEPQERGGEGSLGEPCRAVVRNMGSEASLPAFIALVFYLIAG